jgi:chitin disaccharide deacetylase
MPRGARVALVVYSALATTIVGQAKPPEVLLRLDDVGMNHSVNAATERVAATGMPFSVSLMAVGPEFDEAVAILKKHPQVAVGVHLALNAEWRGYRWGPVLGKEKVPSLVDADGFFLPSVDAFLASKYDLGEVEREMTAQVERAIASGLKITYVDAHMGTLQSTPQLRAIQERVAAKHGLGLSRRFGESYFTLWPVPVDSKKSTLLARLAAAMPDSVNLIVMHVAERSAEMEALFDMNAPAQNALGAGVAAHRQAELDAVLSPEVAELVRSRAIHLTTYAQLAARYKGR